MQLGAKPPPHPQKKQNNKSVLFSPGCSCFGGYPSSAWTFWTKTGLVTGGLYGSKVGRLWATRCVASVCMVNNSAGLRLVFLTGCRPYTIAACEHHVNGTRPPCHSIEDTPKCVKQCIAGYSESYPKDKHFGTIPATIDLFFHLNLIFFSS